LQLSVTVEKARNDGNIRKSAACRLEEYYFSATLFCVYCNLTKRDEVTGE